MLVLGKTNDYKGAQLEQIAQAMLSAKGFQNIELNSVGTGGAEYDVTAEWAGLGVAGPVTVSAVGECKARKDPVNMDDWQKFLGKVYVESQKTGHEMLGLFITTSGVTSNVASSYKELRRLGKHLELVRETEIESFLRKAYEVCSLQEATGSTAKFTNRAVMSIELCYYGKNCYWLVTFQEGAYSLLDAAGQPLKGERLKLMRRLISGATSLKKFIDLYKEREGQRRGGVGAKARNRATDALSRLNKWGRFTGVGDVSPHDLRRTAITRALEMGQTYRQVQMMSKHRDPKTVMRYDHGRENLDQNAVNFLQYEEE